MKLNPCKGTALLAAVLVFCTLFWGMAPLLPARAATKEDLQQQVEDAKQAGCRVMSLQASSMGEPVYRRLGFQMYDTIFNYCRR